MTDEAPIERAIAEKGSEAKLAEASGYSQVAINKARRLGRVTPCMALAISRVTAVTLSELMPEISAAVREEILREGA